MDYLNENVYIIWKDPSYDWTNFKVIGQFIHQNGTEYLWLEGQPQFTAFGQYNHEGIPFTVAMDEIESIEIR